MNAEAPIRIVLADDHPLVRAGIRATLNAAPDMLVVGEATDAHEARRATLELRPDVLLLDLQMPGPRAAETVAYLRQHCPATRVLILTAYDDDAYVRGMVAAGVAGYMLKDEATEAVVRAIRTVVQGDPWLSRLVVEKLVQRPQPTQEPPDHDMSERERRILRLIANGWENARIAAELSLAEQTVRNYVSRIYARIGVSTRAEAVVWARENLV